VTSSHPFSSWHIQVAKTCAQNGWRLQWLLIFVCLFTWTVMEFRNSHGVMSFPPGNHQTKITLWQGLHQYVRGTRDILLPISGVFQPCVLSPPYLCLQLLLPMCFLVTRHLGGCWMAILPTPIPGHLFSEALWWAEGVMISGKSTREGHWTAGVSVHRENG
jgi:hypothetical protein